MSYVISYGIMFLSRKVLLEEALLCGCISQTYIFTMAAP
jgi:hypothetical protein